MGVAGRSGPGGTVFNRAGGSVFTPDVATTFGAVTDRASGTRGALYPARLFAARIDDASGAARTRRDKAACDTGTYLASAINTTNIDGTTATRAGVQPALCAIAIAGQIAPPAACTNFAGVTRAAVLDLAAAVAFIEVTDRADVVAVKPATAHAARD